MEVVRARTLGYCMGVRRAVELAEAALEKERLLRADGKVFSLGPLIHNKTALADLSRRGLFILNETQVDGPLEFSGARAGVAIIRAHGVPPETQSRLEAAGFEIVDATCPLVKRSQKIAAEYSGKDWSVILAGDKNHGEVIGIEGYAGKNFLLVQNEAEAKSLAAPSGDAVLLAQTTFSENEFRKIENALSAKFKSLKVCDTICPATQERQAALAELAPGVDGVLVIGGKNSANTGRLFDTAKNLCKHAALIETADEIPPDFFSLAKVGLAAGASTPDSVIDAVERQLTINN